MPATHCVSDPVWYFVAGITRSQGAIRQGISETGQIIGRCRRPGLSPGQRELVAPKPECVSGRQY